MLDYAANGVVYWPMERLRGSFEHDCEEAGADPAEKIASALGPETDPDAFWIAVDSNLRAGRVRLVFVSDEIPPELRRIIEFLNGQMTPAEVIGIEIKQYVGEGMRTLVPRVFGLTAEAQIKKAVGNLGRPWDRTSFQEEIQKLPAPQALALELVLGASEDSLGHGLGARQDGVLQSKVPHGEREVVLHGPDERHPASEPEMARPGGRRGGGRTRS